MAIDKEERCAEDAKTDSHAPFRPECAACTRAVRVRFWYLNRDKEKNDNDLGEY